MIIMLLLLKTHFCYSKVDSASLLSPVLYMLYR